MMSNRAKRKHSWSFLAVLREGSVRHCLASCKRHLKPQKLSRAFCHRTTCRKARAAAGLSPWYARVVQVLQLPAAFDAGQPMAIQDVNTAPTVTVVMGRIRGVGWVLAVKWRDTVTSSKPGNEAFNRDSLPNSAPCRPSSDELRDTRPKIQGQEAPCLPLTRPGKATPRCPRRQTAASLPYSGDDFVLDARRLCALRKGRQPPRSMPDRARGVTLTTKEDLWTSPRIKMPACLPQCIPGALHEACRRASGMWSLDSKVKKEVSGGVQTDDTLPLYAASRQAAKNKVYHAQAAAESRRLVACRPDRDSLLSGMSPRSSAAASGCLLGRGQAGYLFLSDRETAVSRRSRSVAPSHARAYAEMSPRALRLISLRTSRDVLCRFLPSSANRPSYQRKAPLFDTSSYLVQLGQSVGGSGDCRELQLKGWAQAQPRYPLHGLARKFLVVLCVHSFEVPACIRAVTAYVKD
ncbi:hypothetical protein QBC46DRAFT_454202 [Diplogelasinospora grovesii]|uniref:Uncharacterized protein n=1 Tax=Diplogelasinospora grovesii TaxID=303347 RepID=A0AAN6RZD0_9PEZI|nr:hypothetical protein QBC46DRAFT_454202 [Diplogelasinospora grovesii]